MNKLKNALSKVGADGPITWDERANFGNRVLENKQSDRAYFRGDKYIGSNIHIPEEETRKAIENADKADAAAGGAWGAGSGNPADAKPLQKAPEETSPNTSEPGNEPSTTPVAKNEQSFAATKGLPSTGSNLGDAAVVGGAGLAIGALGYLLLKRKSRK